MPSEPEQTTEPPAESVEKQLCVSCMFPIAPLAHFCAKCGAPMSSYAATGPFESLFAVGHVYRQATDRPRSFVVVLGIWIIFGTMAVAGVAMLFIVREVGLQYVVLGALVLPISLVIIWKTTRSFFTRPRVEERRDANQTLETQWLPLMVGPHFQWSAGKQVAHGLTLSWITFR